MGEGPMEMKDNAAAKAKPPGHFQTLWFTQAEWEAVGAGFSEWTAAGRKKSLNMFMKSRILAEKKDGIPGREELIGIHGDLSSIASEMLFIRRLFEKDGDIDGAAMRISLASEALKKVEERIWKAEDEGGDANGDDDARPYRG